MCERLHRPPPMGWPWDQLADAAIRWDAANRRVWMAQVASDRAEQAKAEFDREQAAADFAALKDEQARQWLAGLRIVLETRRSELAEILGELPPSERVIEELRQLTERVDAAEDAVVDLATDRVVT